MVVSPTFHLSKRIGELLTEAHLVTPAQLEVALFDQQNFSALRLGEILVFRGWLDQQTVDFFAEKWVPLCHTSSRHFLGTYFQAAGLMDQVTVERIIHEQKRNGYRFGANAVLLGFIRQETLDFFLQSLFPEKKDEAPFIFNGKKTIFRSRQSMDSEIRLSESRQHIESKKTIPPKVTSPDEVEWVG